MRYSRKKIYFLSLFYIINSFAYGAQDDALQDEGESVSKAQVEVVQPMSAITTDTSQEEDPLMSITRSGEPQGNYFGGSESLPEHLFGAGGTPFNNDQVYTMSTSTLDSKIKESFEKQKKDWFEELLKKYLESSAINLK